MLCAVGECSIASCLIYLYSFLYSCNLSSLLSFPAVPKMVRTWPLENSDENLFPSVEICLGIALYKASSPASTLHAELITARYIAVHSAN
ncbi:hypothetical protein M430DRAFT_195607 [Amorphotheca resinae ATCC 22711]|uniref:Uncharacterized protein n=1 Tax=Amorphotheca resinae ATCC 22711 TaxID=857342 RepID=A0A2T3APD2_AMORE|nr:hypothetical protein M430DRAFT_195607 [Amorphotheca resinae ATCC 22711]PSS06760.1 hypothetical protein M430DRAFT_195607 [Amorphotheca resinae ATCC 22711]